MDDVVQIIDELEDALLNKKRGFFSGKIYVDQLKVTEILSRLRDAVPQSFYEARSVLKQRDSLISDAERRAENIVRNANETREKLVSESEVLSEAKAEADSLLNSTREYCDSLKYSVSQNLESRLYDSAVRLNDALMFIEEVRTELRKRTPGKDGQGNNQS